MQKKRKININKIRSALYKISNISEGVNIVQKYSMLLSEMQRAVNKAHDKLVKTYTFSNCSTRYLNS